LANPTTASTTQFERTLRLGPSTIRYLIRRTARARGLRLTIDPRRGLVVTLPPATRRGWARGEDRVEAFIRERQPWIVRHLARLERERAEASARGGAVDGGLVPFRGEWHRLRVLPGGPGAARSTVERSGGDAGDELIVRVARRDRRTVERVLEAWFRDRAQDAIRKAVAVHGAALGVSPSAVVLRDPRSRWGSASKTGRLMFSWRLVLAPPAALETVVVHELAHLRIFGHGPGFWRLVASRRPSHLADRAWLRKQSHALHSALDAGREAA
jgi:predicted metal-dependent hydrolase